MFTGKRNAGFVTLFALLLIAGCSVRQPTVARVDLPMVQVQSSGQAVSNARQALENGSYPQAAAYYEVAIEMGEEASPVLLGSATSYVLSGHSSEARRTLRKHVAIHGETFQYLVTAGFVEAVSGRYSVARDLYSEALAMDPQSQTVINNIAQLDKLEGGF